MNRCLVVAALVALGAVARDAGAQTIITGTVRSRAGQPLPGLALLERGEIHNNVWDRGALVGPDGRFRIEVASGGRYGLHVYSSGYLYSPTAIAVATGATLAIDVILVPEPTRANDPVIKQVSFFPREALEGKVGLVRLEVSDPNGDLGPQVLAFSAASGRAYAMDPPRPMRDLKANFPDGVYRLQVDAPAGRLDPKEWHFVVADHQCNTTDILSYPHHPRPPQLVR
jgi:hypothetical protein